MGFDVGHAKTTSVYLGTENGSLSKAGSPVFRVVFYCSTISLIPALSLLWGVENEGHRLPLPVKGSLLPPFMGVAEKSSLPLAPTPVIKSTGLLTLETC